MKVSLFTALSRPLRIRKRSQVYRNGSPCHVLYVSNNRRPGHTRRIPMPEQPDVAFLLFVFVGAFWG